jgi:hypothetical protein
MTYFDQMAEEILFPSLNADEDTDWAGIDFDDYDDSMDGDHESALASAGWGEDESYGYYGEDDAGW